MSQAKRVTNTCRCGIKAESFVDACKPEMKRLLTAPCTCVLALPCPLAEGLPPNVPHMVGTLAQGTL